MKNSIGSYIWEDDNVYVKPKGVYKNSLYLAYRDIDEDGNTIEYIEVEPGNLYSLVGFCEYKEYTVKKYGVKVGDRVYRIGHMAEIENEKYDFVVIDISYGLYNGLSVYILETDKKTGKVHKYTTQFEEYYESIRDYRESLINEILE